MNNITDEMRQTFGYVAARQLLRHDWSPYLLGQLCDLNEPNDPVRYSAFREELLDHLHGLAKKDDPDHGPVQFEEEFNG